MDETLNANLIPTPQKFQNPKDVDTSRKCRYLQNFGHKTEECQALKDKIEELIQVDTCANLCKSTKEARITLPNIGRSIPKEIKGGIIILDEIMMMTDN